MGHNTDALSESKPLAIASGADRQSLCTSVERDVNLVGLVCKHYHKDPTFAKILSNPEAHPCFGICNWLIWTKNQMGRDVICLPRKAFLRGRRRLVEIIVDHAHTTIGHFGPTHTMWYIHRYYW